MESQLSSAPPARTGLNQSVAGLFESIKGVKNQVINKWSELVFARRVFRQLTQREAVSAAAKPSEPPAADFIETLYRRAVPHKLHMLLQLRVAARIGSVQAVQDHAQHCLNAGWNNEQVSAALLNNPTSVFSEGEKLLLRYADDVTRTPIDVDFKVVRRLEALFNDSQMREIAACIAHENFRIRFGDAVQAN